ncbi:MAG TPA: hypothetical protein VEC57_14985 [Candidatus Limnocylindrales bacterium]|nr:hypothetical protein [Candidatus Limnocylindrales bacterium]
MIGCLVAAFLAFVFAVASAAAAQLLPVGSPEQRGVYVEALVSAGLGYVFVGAAWWLA